MGLPFPPPWEEGTACANCKDVIFGGRTPEFVYADVQGVVKCPGIPAGAPSPNGVWVLTQVVGFPCSWNTHLISGVWDYGFTWLLSPIWSRMNISDVSAMPVFHHQIAAVCQDSFINQNACPDPSGFSGGTCEITW